MEKDMKKVLSLLVGENQDIRIVIMILTPPAFFSLFVLLSYSMDYRTILTSVLAFDIFAGLLSNSQEKTHLAWGRVSKSYHKLFVVIHLTLYPLMVILFNVSIPLMILMLAMLLAKTAAFALGNKLF
jgi:hypothetical protein